MAGPTADRFKIGFSLHQGNEDALARDLDRAVALGADLVELAISPTECIVGGRVNRHRVQALATALKSTPLSVTVHAPLSFSMMDMDHMEIQTAVGLACLDVCAAFGAVVMVIHPGWINPVRFEKDRDTLMAIEGDGLRFLAGQAASRGVTLALENMPTAREFTSGQVTTYGFDPQAVARQVAAVNHPNLRATIDFSHAYMACRYFGWTLADRLADLGPLTTHLHFHDSFGRSPTKWDNLFPSEDAIFGEGDLHLPLGWGDLPYEATMPALTLPKTVTATLETGLAWRDDATARTSLARARALCTLVQKVA